MEVIDRALTGSSSSADGNRADKKSPVEPIDHFIFYRGAGNHSFHELRATQGKGGDTFTLANYGEDTVPKLIALRVGDGQSSLAGAGTAEEDAIRERETAQPADLHLSPSHGHGRGGRG